jgi:phosphatidate cytidylyltransferase
MSSIMEGNADAPGEGASGPQEDYGRAGRNLGAAVSVGILLLVLIGVSLWLATWVLALVVAAAAVLAVHELRDAFGRRAVVVADKALYAGAVAMVLGAYFGGAYYLVVAFGATVLVILLQRLSGDATGFVRDVSASVFIAAYVPFMLSFAMLLLRVDDGAARMIALVLLTAGTDTGGYIAGVLFGRHPMAPSISPKKSWEGLVGSIVLNVAVGAVFFVFVFDSPWTYGALAGVTLALVGTLGDLAESMIKRDVGIKDMSSLLPGHGGIMDRLDSVIPNSFAAWALFSVLLG